VNLSICKRCKTAAGGEFVWDDASDKQIAAGKGVVCPATKGDRPVVFVREGGDLPESCFRILEYAVAETKS